MNRKLDTPRNDPEQPYTINDRPAILGGTRMPKFELPPGFDLTLHKKILASGKVKPATPRDYAREIALLKQRIKDGLG